MRNAARAAPQDPGRQSASPPKETTMTVLSRLTLPALALALCSTALLAGGIARADDATNAMKPAANAMKPAADAMKPATDAMKPADPMATNAMKPADNAMKPAADAMKPAADAMKPAADAMAPAN
ncbi:hypothetical protein X742_31055 [Mesorhizobium sp. LNHC232B00]|nr:hypothetical protein X742_31055 [Mesorhizobium sp. LNHC232B00]